MATLATSRIEQVGCKRNSTFWRLAIQLILLQICREKDEQDEKLLVSFKAADPPGGVEWASVGGGQTNPGEVHSTVHQAEPFTGRAMKRSPASRCMNAQAVPV